MFPGTSVSSAGMGEKIPGRKYMPSPVPGAIRLPHIWRGFYGSADLRIRQVDLPDIIGGSTQIPQKFFK